MPGVVAWIVAVEGYQGDGGRASPLDFPSSIAGRAMDWAEWLKKAHPDALLLLNVSLRASAPATEQDRLKAIAIEAGNATDGVGANVEALHASLRRVQSDRHDVLILIWIGHGVMVNSDRYLVHHGARRVDALRSWQVASLLQSMRRDTAPPVQIGVFDTCANLGVPAPGVELLAGVGNVARSQHFVFSAVAGAQASLSADRATGASVALEAMQGLDWPPSPEDFAVRFQSLKGALGLAPAAFERTSGSGDLWERSGQAGSERDRLDHTARRENVEPILLAHLWDARSALPLEPQQLAIALRGGRLDELVTGLERLGAPGTDLLRAAVRRVDRVLPWKSLVQDLGLGLGQWMSLAQLVASGQGRPAPPGAEVQGLMLWALEAGQGPADPRSEEQLLHLLLLGVQRASPSSGAMARRLSDAIDADAVFAPMRVAVAKWAKLPEAPITVVVELGVSGQGGAPTIACSWLLLDEHFESPDDTPLAGPLGKQLSTLMARVGARAHGRPLRVELLAPASLLIVNEDWLISGPVELDRRYPIVWRSRDRLSNDIDWDKPGWMQRAPAVRARALAKIGLPCRFVDDPIPPAALDQDVVRGIATVPRARQGGSKLRAFLGELMAGHPYMVWPCRSPQDAPAFMRRVEAWLAQQPLEQLPERYREARDSGHLPPLVLFIDEPGRDPFQQQFSLP